MLKSSGCEVLNVLACSGTSEGDWVRSDLVGPAIWAEGSRRLKRAELSCQWKRSREKVNQKDQGNSYLLTSGRRTAR